MSTKSGSECLCLDLKHGRAWMKLHMSPQTPQLSDGYEEAETDNPLNLIIHGRDLDHHGQVPEREGAGSFDLVLCQAHRGVEGLYAVPLGGIRTPKTQGISWRAQHNTMTIGNETLVRLSRQTELYGHQWSFGAAPFPELNHSWPMSCFKDILGECPVHAHATVPTAQLAGDP
ncbi:hypothetical protein J3F84DRAFT_404311 [Trichoderma pleuroticola]